MENYRLKVKIGDAEFDAEGPHDVVQAQFQAFQEMLATVPARPTDKAPDSTRTPLPAENGTPKLDVATIDAMLSKIMKVENRIVSLTATPTTVDEAVVLLLYGQRLMRNNESVTGSEVLDGIMATGGIDIGRSDRTFERIARSGDIVMIGVRRGKRYRLTNAGMNKARQIAAGLIALVA